jgi:hypothetical protein
VHEQPHVPPPARLHVHEHVLALKVNVWVALERALQMAALRGHVQLHCADWTKPSVGHAGQAHEHEPTGALGSTRVPAPQ